MQLMKVGLNVICASSVCISLQKKEKKNGRRRGGLQTVITFGECKMAQFRRTPPNVEIIASPKRCAALKCAASILTEVCDLGAVIDFSY